MGAVMRSGKDWEYTFSDWSHAFVVRKDPRCLAQEPPSWFPKERRVMLAGVAEFFSNLYGLPKPTWTDKPEYFLPKPTYLTMLLPDTGEGLHRLCPHAKGNAPQECGFRGERPYRLVN